MPTANRQNGDERETGDLSNERAAYPSGAWGMISRRVPTGVIDNHELRRTETSVSKPGFPNATPPDLELHWTRSLQNRYTAV